MANHIDTIGVVEYYTTHLGAVEDAGEGMVRLIKGIERNGIFQPVYCVVQPAFSLVRTRREIDEIARQILRSGRAH